MWVRKYCQNIDNEVSLPPKIALLLRFVTQTIFTVKNQNHSTKWLLPLESQDWNNSFEPSFESIYIDLEARIFSTRWLDKKYSHWLSSQESPWTLDNKESLFVMENQGYSAIFLYVG